MDLELGPDRSRNTRGAAAISLEGGHLEPRSKLWVERNGQVVLSDWRIDLLKAIDRTGSLSRAAEEMNTPYRTAWQRLKETEERLGQRLVETQSGGPEGGGSALTDAGRDLVRRYERFSEGVAELGGPEVSLCVRLAFFLAAVMQMAAERPKPAGAGNRYDRMEWAGAFGDLGTLIPFVVGYIAVLKMDPVGILLAFGLTKVAVGLLYRTPMPVQPMKAIGGAAIGQAGAITPGMVYGAGLVTAAIWLVLGLTGTVDRLARLASKPVVRGIVLGLGFTFVLESFRMMGGDPIVAGFGLIITYLLLSRPKLPAMFVLLFDRHRRWPSSSSPTFRRGSARPGFHLNLPYFPLGSLTWQDVLLGGLVLALPQLPLTLGNACIAVVAENNDHFCDRPVTERKVATSMGLMNLFSPVIGGVPMCHGAGGMAGHVRFGARTGGALVILGVILVLMALFLGDSVHLIFQAFPPAILGVILFFAGIELALSARDIGPKKEDFYVMLATAAFAIWNMGAAFVVGVLLYHALGRGIVKL